MPVEGMRERQRETEEDGAGGRARQRAARANAAQFAKSTSSTLTRRQSSGVEVVLRSSQPPACLHLSCGRHWLASLAPPPPPPQSPALLCPSLPRLHNATLAEDGKERTHSFRIPPDPTSGSCSWVYHSKQRGSHAPRKAHTGTDDETL